MLDKTVKEAHTVGSAIPNSHNLHSTITEGLQKDTDLKEELINNMATENCLYNTISTIHSRYYAK